MTDDEALPAPMNIIVTADVEKLSLTWDAVEGAEFYRIHAKSESIGGWEQVGTPITNNFTHINLVGGETYEYILMSQSSSGIPSGESDKVSGVALVNPNWLKVSPSRKAIVLRWDPEDPVWGDVTHFKVRFIFFL